MGSILSKLWSDPDYFKKSLTVVLGTIAVLLPLLPLGDLGAFGFWLGKLGLPLVIAYGATARGSGLTADQAAKLRALIPDDATLNKIAPPI
jgi:hypothetical protein